MREIKFRAWSSFHNRYFYNILVGNGKVINRVETEDECFYESDISMEYFESIEQYTGLKDKNGVEIYEGDIVQWSVDADQVGEEPLSDTYTVIYRNGGFYLENHKDIYPKYEPISEVVRFCGEYQVLGNIYEHAELIKESKHE